MIPEPKGRACRRLAAGLAFLLAACGPAIQPTADTTPLVWPERPDEPRIAYVKTFSKPADLGIEPGFFRRLVDLLFGGNDARLIRPTAVTVSRGLVFVADPGARGVHRFDLAKGDYALIQAPGERPLLSPIGLANGAGGDVYVTDSALAQVFVIHPGDKSATPLALQAPLSQPTGIAYDPAEGRLFVVSTTGHRIDVFNRAGALESSIGRRGSGDGEFNYPTLLWRSREGRLYLTDSLNFRVQMFDPQGRFAGKFGSVGDGTGDLPRQKGVATDRYGHIYIVDAVFQALQVFDERGQFLLTLGALGQGRGEFWLPTGLFIDDDDTIYVADSYNRRVQVFRYIGGPT